jgi:amino acid transporter
MAGDAREKQFLQAEHLVELKSSALKKELRLGDLILSQTLYIVGIQWLGTAGKLGSAHVMYWIPAVLLFYIPSGIVVTHLASEMPLEGGLYQWAKLRFGEMMGFLVALNLWATVVLIVASTMSVLTDNVGYAAGPSGAWIVESKLITAALSALVIGGLTLIAVRGMSIAKWLHNVGGFVLVFMLAAMLLLAMPRWLHGTSVTAPIALTFPAVTLLNLNIAAKMGFGAFCGFDGCCIFSGEIRNPNIARTIRRSIFLSGPLIALIYIAGTASALAFTRPADLDLISTPMQALTRGAHGASFAFIVAPVAAAFLIVNLLGGASIYFNAVNRLPMVAGWDHLLPAWLSRLHPRFKTPVGSIICVAVATFCITLFGNFGVGAQEAFQFLNNAGIICWALTYLVMFSIPLIARGEKPSLGVRAASASGLGMTLLYVLLSIFPIVDVKNSALFTAKVILLILGINAAGAWYFRRASKLRENLAVASMES